MKGALGTACAGLFIGAAIAYSGWQFSQSFIAARTVDRIVAVKGLAEREVIADTAIWPLRFTTTDDDLSQALRKIAMDEGTVRKFLTDGGISADGISV